MIGTTIAGRYEIIEQVGIGGMGVVYRAHDTTLERDVAVKIVAPHLVQQEEARQRFKREAQAVAGLTHPNIVAIYDFVEDKETGSAGIIMELLRGASLRQRMADANRPAFSAVAIQTCRALEAAHGKGILHRDIKPENIFVCDDGTLKLMDFGLARLLDSASTQSSMLAGTVSYMAPEQLRGEKLDARSDLYSLGVLLYEYLAGVTPFAADNPGATLLKHLNEAPPPLRDKLPSLPAEIEAIVMRLLAKDPHLRYASAKALREALENPTPSGKTTQVELANTYATLPRTPMAPRPLVTPTVLTPLTAPLVVPPKSEKGPYFVPARNEPRRSPVPLLALGGLLLLAGGGSIAAYLHGQNSSANLAIARKQAEKKPVAHAAHSASMVSRPTREQTPDEVAQLSRSLHRTEAELAKERREAARLRKQKAAEEAANRAANPGSEPSAPATIPDSALNSPPQPTDAAPAVTPKAPAQIAIAPAPAAPKTKLSVEGWAQYLPRMGNVVRVQLAYNTDCNVRFYAVQSGEGQAVNMASSLDHLGVGNQERGSGPLDLTLTGATPPPFVIMVASTKDLTALAPSFQLPAELQGGDGSAAIGRPQAAEASRTIQQHILAMQGKRKKDSDTVVRLLQVRGWKRRG